MHLIGESTGFDSRQYPKPLRLKKFSERITGGPLQTRKRLDLQPLDSDNANVNVTERLQGVGCHLLFQKSSGYSVMPAVRPGPDARFDIVMVSVLKKGRAQANSSYGSFSLGAGDIYIHATCDFKNTFGETEFIRLAFPPGSLNELCRRAGEFVVVRNHDPVGAVLKAAISDLELALRSDCDASGRLLSRMAIDIASTVIEHNIRRTAISGHEIVRERAREYIHDNITSADLGVTEIAAYVGASRATLYRSFESLGGIRHYITSARLELAKSMLGTGKPDRGGIARVAYACGFSSPGQMSKAFKQHFGVSPRVLGAKSSFSGSSMGAPVEHTEINFDRPT